MKPDPILEELRKVKDDLARDAGYDTHRFFDGLRRWEIEHPHPGMVVSDAEELRRLLPEAEAKQAGASALAFNDAARPERSSTCH